MSDDKLSQKIAYFKEQDLLDLSDDEIGFPDARYLYAERELENAKPLSLLKPPSRSNSFLGPTPKERQADFEVYSKQERAMMRTVRQPLTWSATAPETGIVLTNIQNSKAKQDASSRSIAKSSMNERKVNSTSSPHKRGRTSSGSQVPFYIQIGIVPREQKSGKNVKPANKIQLRPVHKQLLREKIVYFYPNDDISMARRKRIHKVIELGAAWVTSWRYDITHIIVDDASYTYAQLLRHLNMAGIPKNIVLVVYQPYVPECIERGMMLDPTANRFLVKGQPKPTGPTIPTEPTATSSSSQNSLQIKASERRPRARAHNMRASTPPREDLIPSSMELEIIVKDSFIQPSSEANNEQATTSHADQVDESTSKETPINEYNDALSQAIQEAKATSHLPLDEEDDSDPSRPGTATSQDSHSDNDFEVESPKRFSKLTQKFRYTDTTTTANTSTGSKKGKGLDLSTFQCMNTIATNPSNSSNPNARTIQILQEMCTHYDQTQDTWRTLAYRKAITTLKKQRTKITTAKQAATLPFIGSRLADKIEEIVLTDRLRKLDSTRDDPTAQILRLFLGVYGAGLSQANKWIQAGHRSLDDLVSKARLTKSQRIGIQHYEDFATRIPRGEVESHSAVVRSALANIDPGFNVIIVGSYRRGAKDTGDIDLIINCPGSSHASMSSTIFETLVPHLFKTGFLKATLATSSRYDVTGSKWHGASCLPSSTIWRRLDLLLVPDAEIGAALIYFTGNDIFNRSMRLLARKKGMRLNQRGLYKDVARGRYGEKLSEGELVEGRDEKKIFEVLGVPWREPHERIC